MKKAFSLIELSIVILIIGILVAGVTQASRLVAQMRLASARAITQSSPVTSISGLTLWLDSTSEKSFADSETADAASISTWYDLNPQSITKINVGQATPSLQPTYSTNSANGLPSLFFNGFQSFYLASLLGGGLFSTDQVSVFIVQKYLGGDTSTIFWGTPSGALRFNIHAFHTSSGSFYFDFGNCCDATSRISVGVSISAVSNVFEVISAVKKSSGAFEARINGGTPIVTSATMTSNLPTNSSSTLYIGSSDEGHIFAGYIAEVIVFNRGLKADERQDIEKYLGKKWGIKVN